MDDLDFLFPDDVAADESVFDPSQVITILSSGGGSWQVPLHEGEATLSVEVALTRAELAVSPNTEYWVNGVQVQRDHQLGPGATIATVGNVKGG